MTTSPAGTPPPEAYTLVPRTPSPAEFCALRLAAGMSPRSLEAATHGLPRSVFAVTILHGQTPVGMGRIVGDGAVVFYVADIAVHPDHQRRGLGKRIVAALVDWLQTNAPPSAAVCLHADGDARFLYAKFGFTPTADDDSIGMELKRSEPRL